MTYRCAYTHKDLQVTHLNNSSVYFYQSVHFKCLRQYKSTEAPCALNTGYVGGVFWNTTLTIKAETEGTPPFVPDFTNSKHESQSSPPSEQDVLFQSHFQPKSVPLPNLPHTKTGARLRQRSLCFFCSINAETKHLRANAVFLYLCTHSETVQAAHTHFRLNYITFRG